MQTLEKRSAIVVIVIAMLLVSSVSTTAEARGGRGPDPQGIFDRCVDFIDHHTERCNNRTVRHAKEAVAEIRKLLEAGEVEAAREVAAEAIRKIEAHTAQCIELIRRRCIHCAERLVALGEDRLAARLREHCAQQLDSIKNHRDRAIGFIRSQF